MIRWVLTGACFLASTHAYGSSPEARVTAVEHSIAKDRVRVVVRFSAAVQYAGGTATDPFRLYFDLHGTRPAAALPASSAVGDSVVRRVRLGQYQPGITRVVLDMTRPAPFTATFLADPARLVIEVMRSGATTGSVGNPSPSAATRAKLAPASAASITPVPAPALVPEQMPPLPPQVTYQNGLLTIMATNSTLADVLQAVAARTNATLDAPSDLIGQRVAARLGPAPPRAVMTDLLQGMDYVLVGSSNDPEAIRSIILSPTSAASVAAIPAPAAVSAPPAEAETVPEEEAESSNPAAKQPSAPQAPPVKTPEELLEELRRLQEQQPNTPPR